VGKHSAGIILFRRDPDGPRFLLVRPGGPFFAHCGDDPIWGIPKGEFNPEVETPTAAARREFSEELGPAAPRLTTLIPLGTVQQGAKLIHGFAAEGDFDPAQLQSNTFELQFPRGSGKIRSFPEVDLAAWCCRDEVCVLMHPAQRALIDRLIAQL